ncbi:MAG TPA: multicopper oxidase domain-containing protein [Pyrinomonadaceae bacterium]|nr:multicopper oxidase domain-containing protein [Pyrinomonadaceae bacterium]
MRTISPAFAIAALMVLSVSHVQAQAPSPTPTPIASPVNPCPQALMPRQPLIPVPVISSANGKLRGTIVLSDEEEWMTFRVPTTAPPGVRSQCMPQHVRTFREWGATPAMAKAPYGQYLNPKPGAPDLQFALPRPGPTLRARVGDLVQLTFVNQINVLNFPFSIDRGETGVGGGCDESNANPPYPGADRFPDCFHGSSTGNIHFHGTHTNPNTTGDNVFIEVRPLPRDNSGKLTTSPEKVTAPFEKFFAKCEVELGRSQLREWPRAWDDLPADYTDEQKKLLKEYDTQLEKKYGARVQKLWPVDEAQLKQSAWPQYYIGAAPYCFRLPAYTPTTSSPAAMNMNMGGAGSAEISAEGGQDSAALIMGQAPGTHWYHAHKHGSTAINVANGMTGAFIIEGQYDDDLNTWYGDGWTRNAQVLVVNQLGVTPNLLLGGGGTGGGQDKGPDFSVNGQIQPTIHMNPGEVQMWRILNTSGRASMFFMDPPPGFEWKQIAQDGVQFSDYNYKHRSFKNITVAPGNRVDLLVKAPGSCASAIAGACQVMVKNMVDPADLKGKNPAKPLTLLSIDISGKPVDPSSNQGQFIKTAPTPPTFLNDIADSEIKATRTIRFSSDASQNFVQHMIDGKKFDGEVGAVILLNQAEEWKIVNETYGGRIVSHPFHIHINPFQITEIFDPNATFDYTYTEPKTGKKMTAAGVAQYAFVPGDLFTSSDVAFQKAVRARQCQLNPSAEPDSWKPCGPPFVNKNNIWWDVFPIPSGRSVQTSKGTVNVPGYFKMRSRFVDYPGFYVMHCHILAHEDRGMMTIVEVAPARTPYSHH